MPWFVDFGNDKISGQVTWHLKQDPGVIINMYKRSAIFRSLNAWMVLI